MDLMQSFDAILFPSDGRPPHVVSLMTSPASFANPHIPAQTNAARVPHPEVLMEYIAEDPNMRAWHYLVRFDGRSESTHPALTRRIEKKIIFI